MQSVCVCVCVKWEWERSLSCQALKQKAVDIAAIIHWGCGLVYSVGSQWECPLKQHAGSSLSVCQHMGVHGKRLWGFYFLFNRTLLCFVSLLTYLLSSVFGCFIMVVVSVKWVYSPSGVFGCFVMLCVCMRASAVVGVRAVWLMRCILSSVFWSYFSV